MSEQKKLLGAHDLIDSYRLSRVKAYQILNDKSLPVIRLGRRLFVRAADFEAWLDTQRAGGAGD